MNVTMESSLVTITLELDAEQAPLTVANFVSYAKEGHYYGLVFHRVIKGFMLQGGGYDEKMKLRDSPDCDSAANDRKPPILRFFVGLRPILGGICLVQLFSGQTI